MNEEIAPHSIFPQYDLGLIVTVINKYGSRTSFFANEILYVSVRTNKIFAKARGESEEWWIDDADSNEEANEIAERFLSIIGSIRMNGVDQT